MRTRVGRDVVLSLAGTVGVVAAWEAVSRSGLVSPLVFPPPSRVVGVTLARMPVAELLGHVGTSLGRICWGFGVAAALGILVGIASGWYRWLGVLMHPVIELLRPIPPLAWIPIAIIWFGLGEASKVFVIFLGAFFPVVTNTYRGMVGIDPMLLRAAQTMGLAGPALLFRVAIPAAMPDIATGIRVGWGLAFGVLVAAELIAADRGMGFLVMHARQFGEIGVIIFGILLIGATNLMTDYGIGEVIRRRLLRGRGA
ncbi:MAG TPA: ABC transporter permease [Methylomirabilota bacterium]|jgi:ABC-type nitrate/sulfonate/bicarbonate transport system permease component|nr:ABC transporter permease [Methylomirabilota bacterium]HEV8672711.1 ABC transporter permease [Methylomirabilota bacterium]